MLDFEHRGLRSVWFPKYDFIPDDKSLLKNEGFCVFDQFLGIYQPHIASLNAEVLDNLCKHYWYNIYQNLDHITEIDPNGDGTTTRIKPKVWDKSRGISTM